MMSKGTVGKLAQEPDHDFAVVTANMPVSAVERRVAFALIAFLFVIFGMVAPFARVPLPRVDAFIPVIQTVVCVAELVTAILLFAQYSIQPQPRSVGFGQRLYFQRTIRFSANSCFSRRIRTKRLDRRSID